MEEKVALGGPNSFMILLITIFGPSYLLAYRRLLPVAIDCVC